MLGNPSRRDLVGPALALAVFVYLSVVAAPGSANWRWDDTQILLSVLRFPVLDFFSDPDTWQSFSAANLTPWLLASYKLDYTLFGLRPTLFYLHQLVALTLVCGLLYLLLRLWVGRVSAGAGALLFVSGAPLAYLSQQLMTRHYVEGAVFALLSLYLYVRYLRQPRIALLLASLAAYGLAATAKEVYVPLVLLLPLIPESHWRRRLLAAIPFVALAFAYSAWRAFMLGTLTGGYSPAASAAGADSLAAVTASFAALPSLLLGQASLPFSVLLLLLALHFFINKPAALLLAIVTVAAALGPLLPLLQSPGISSPDRYLFVPWLVLCFAVAVFIDSARQRFPTALGSARRPALLVALALLVLMPLPRTWSARNEVLLVAREFDAQTEFIWAHSAEAAYIPPANVLAAFWFVQGLTAIKSAQEAASSVPTPVIDPLFLDSSLTSLFVFDHGCLCFVDDSASLPARRAAFQQRYRPDATLSLRYSYTDLVFSWQAGPYDSGNWHFLSEQLGGLAPVPRQGQLRLYLAEGGRLYLRYTSPEGWVTYSDALIISNPQPPITWQR